MCLQLQFLILFKFVFFARIFDTESELTPRITYKASCACEAIILSKALKLIEPVSEEVSKFARQAMDFCDYKKSSHDRSLAKLNEITSTLDNTYRYDVLTLRQILFYGG